MGKSQPTADVVWRPSAEQVRTANLTAFLEAHGLPGYDALQTRAAEDPHWFWDAVIRHGDLRFHEPYETVLDLSGGAPWARWCVGGRTNVVLNCIDKHRGTPVWEQEAISWEGEDGERRSWSYAELNTEICRFAAGLRAMGFGPGDVIALYSPFLPESVAAMLAIPKIGAVVMPLFSGFGADAIVQRMNDAGAVGVVTVDATWRRGVAMGLKAVIDQAAREVPTLRNVVVIGRIGGTAPMTPGRDLAWEEVCAGQPAESPTQPMDAEAPMMLVYTSGTTGRSKGCILTHCGFATKVTLDFGLCMDFKPGDRFLWMSDMGWVVGPITTLTSTLLRGTMVIAEGGPDYPEPGRMWRLVRDHRVTYLGVAPTIIRSLMRYGPAEVEKYDLSSLRMMTSSGEPWTPDAWHWAFRHVGGSRIPLHNISGGTEISGGIVCTTAIHPMKPCAFTGPIPGSGADIVDEGGGSTAPGQLGELVMRAPSIGLTRGLWNDPDGSRYLEAYWNRMPGLWVQGDFAYRDPDGFWFLTGRSDDVFNVAGKRTGPYEAETLLLATGQVAQAAVIGVPDPVKGEALVCVCVAAGDAEAGDALAEALSGAIAAGLGRPFRPREVLFVSDLPKTRNMKTLRRVVRAVCQGQPPGDLSSLVNPEAVAELEAVVAARAKQAK